MRRVVITGMGALSALGDNWETIKAGLLRKENAVTYMQDWDVYNGLLTKLGAPVTYFKVPDHYTRKKIRSMGRVALFATYTSELALKDAGLLGDPCVSDGSTGIAFGSCTGSTKPLKDFGTMFMKHDTGDITSTTYLQMMPHTTAVNAGLFFGVKGRLIPTSSACTSGSQAIGYAYEAIRFGLQEVMLAGGAEELSPSEAAVFDTLFATTQKNATPKLTPSPFDKDRDGLVLGEGSGTLVLEELEHARARGARIYAEILSFATNCDASHVTQPKSETMEICMRRALKDSGLTTEEIGYISAHDTGTTRGDIAESQATFRLFGSHTPISSLKSYLGHTLGACGALEAIVSLKMMEEGWFHPTLNLKNVDPECGELDYIVDSERKIDTGAVMTNNFAFGGINTSIVLKRWG